MHNSGCKPQHVLILWDNLRANYSIRRRSAIIINTREVIGYLYIYYNKLCTHAVYTHAALRNNLHKVGDAKRLSKRHWDLTIFRAIRFHRQLNYRKPSVRTILWKINNVVRSRSRGLIPVYCST